MSALNPKNTIVIAVANHKGGVGKTTTVVNLAFEFSKIVESVCVIDMDPQANATIHIGKRHPAEITVGAFELMTGDMSQLTPAIIHDTRFENVSLIAGSLQLGRVEHELKDTTPRPSEELRRKINPLLGVYDVILIDCPPSLTLLTSNALAAATHYIVPIKSGEDYGHYGVSDLLTLIKKILIVNPDLKCLGALLLSHDERENVCKIQANTTEKLVGSVLPVKISRSTKVMQAQVLKQSLHQIDRTSKLAREYRALATHLADTLGMQSVGVEHVA